MNKDFNIILSGVGGQGIITLLSLIDEAAFIEDYNVKSSEIHGLSQRGGSVEAHVRFGEKINSPLVSNGEANLIISLEILEALRSASMAGKQTQFLINDFMSPFIGGLPKEKIKERLSNFKNKTYFVEASVICKEKLKNDIVSTVYLLGYAVKQKLIPLKKESILLAIERVIPEKYQEINIKAFNLSYGN